MAHTQYYCAASLDGFIADADDGLEWLTGYDGSYDGEGAQPSPMGDGGAYEVFYEGVGALISGSATYEWLLEHADAWPYPGKPYWVLSSRHLQQPGDERADVRVADADVGELHAELSDAADGGSIWIVGGGGVASQFAASGLLDEVILTVVPVVLGRGKPLFERGLPEPMQLTGTTPFESGMVELRYAVGPR